MRYAKLRPLDSQLALPSYHTVRRAVKSYPAYEQAVAKYGKQEASIRFRTSLAAAPAKYILEAAEIDHTPVDLFVIDEHRRLPLGRATLTLLIDRKSRMILGIYVSFGGPSTEAVFLCLKHAILPKDYLKERYPRVEGNWPCHGLPETLVCDNGLEFHSKALEQACFELGIILQFCPKKKPYFKGRVERTFRSIAHGFFHVQKGTSLANWMDRHGYDPLKTAVATLDEFMHALHIWIVDVYSASFHRGLDRTPLGVWNDGVLNNPPRLPDLHTLDVALTEFEQRVLWHYGIELFNLRYNSRDLTPIRSQLGEKVAVQVRYNRADKHNHPEFMFELNNLAAACKPCNTSKNTKTPLSNPVPKPTHVPLLTDDYKIVHPHIDEWEEHLEFDMYGRIHSKPNKPKGQETINMCGIHALNSASLSDYFSVKGNMTARKALFKFFTLKQKGTRIKYLGILRSLADIYDLAEAKAIVARLEQEL